MNIVTGAYACRLLDSLLGAPAGRIGYGTPLENFGGVQGGGDLLLRPPRAGNSSATC